MQGRLPRQRQTAGGNVGVPIAEQQCGLEEHQAGGPDGGGASEAWKNQLGEQWLQQEKEKCAEENGHRQQEVQAALGPRSGRKFNLVCRSSFGLDSGGNWWHFFLVCSVRLSRRCVVPAEMSFELRFVVENGMR